MDMKRKDFSNIELLWAIWSKWRESVPESNKDEQEIEFEKWLEQLFFSLRTQHLYLKIKATTKLGKWIQTKTPYWEACRWMTPYGIAHIKVIQ